MRIAQIDPSLTPERRPRYGREVTESGVDHPSEAPSSDPALFPTSPHVDLTWDRVRPLNGGLPGSGSSAFDDLREELRRTPALRSELEAALDLNVQRVNPTDRANRFGSGAAVEWILACVAFSAGVLSVPGGHNANGFDLRDLRSDARGLWSVKNQTKRGEWRITNGLGGSGSGLKDPTIFVSPSLPGLTFVDPGVHADVSEQVVVKSDAVTLPARVVEEHAQERPECVAACVMPKNPGTGVEDPWQDYVENLLAPQRFPRLSRLFAASSPVAGTLTSELMKLVELRDAGALSANDFSVLIAKLGG